MRILKEDIILNKNVKLIPAIKLRIGDIIYVNEYFEEGEKYLYPIKQIDSQTKEATIVYISQDDSDIEIYLNINNYGIILNKNDMILRDNTSDILDVYDDISSMTDNYDISTVPVKASTINIGDIIVYENNLARVTDKVQFKGIDETTPITIATNKGILNTLKGSIINKLFVRR